MKVQLHLLLLVGLTFIQWTVAAQNKVLIVTGGHDFEKEPFYEMFDSFEGLEYDTIVQPMANEMLSKDQMRQYSCIVFYDMYQDITERQKEAYLQLLGRGVGMVFLHHSLVSYQDWPEFERIIGGKYHLEESQGQVKSTYQHDVDFEIEIMTGDDRHPVTEGLTSFMIHDEVYGSFSVVEGVEPLLRTGHPESTPTIGWAHVYKNSKVVYLQPGHDHYAYENENYRQLVRQAIEWARTEITIH
jgi:hypothetical protein